MSLKRKPVEKPWLKSYPEGMPATVPEPPWRSVRDLIEHSFATYPDHAAYTNLGKTLRYGDLNRLSINFAAFLKQRLGLTRG